MQKAIRIKNPNYKRPYLKLNDKITITDIGNVILPDEVTPYITKVIEVEEE